MPRDVNVRNFPKGCIFSIISEAIFLAMLTVSRLTCVIKVVAGDCNYPDRDYTYHMIASVVILTSKRKWFI